MGESKLASREEPSSMAAMGSGVRRRLSTPDPILEVPHPALCAVSYDVDPLAVETVELSAALIGMMRATPGCIGLSAPQLGRNVRLFCLDVTGQAASRSCAGLILLANPELLCVSGKVTMREGCTSVPLRGAHIERASEVVVSGIVPGTGRKLVVQADALEARVLLHQLDHLEGILFLDRIPAVVRSG
jgi:peptide deformylase